MGSNPHLPVSALLTPCFPTSTLCPLLPVSGIPAISRTHRCYLPPGFSHIPFAAWTRVSALKPRAWGQWNSRWRKEDTAQLAIAPGSSHPHSGARGPRWRLQLCCYRDNSGCFKSGALSLRMLCLFLNSQLLKQPLWQLNESNLDSGCITKPSASWGCSSPFPDWPYLLWFQHDTCGSSIRTSSHMCIGVQLLVTPDRTPQQSRFHRSCLRLWSCFC